MVSYLRVYKYRRPHAPATEEHLSIVKKIANDKAKYYVLVEVDTKQPKDRTEKALAKMKRIERKFNKILLELIRR